MNTSPRGARATDDHRDATCDIRCDERDSRLDDGWVIGQAADRHPRAGAVDDRRGAYLGVRLHVLRSSARPLLRSLIRPLPRSTRQQALNRAQFRTCPAPVHSSPLPWVERHRSRASAPWSSHGRSGRVVRRAADRELCRVLSVARASRDQDSFQCVRGACTTGTRTMVRRVSPSPSRDVPLQPAPQGVEAAPPPSRSCAFLGERAICFT